MKKNVWKQFWVQPGTNVLMYKKLENSILCNYKTTPPPFFFVPNLFSWRQKTRIHIFRKIDDLYDSYDFYQVVWFKTLFFSRLLSELQRKTNVWTTKRNNMIENAIGKDSSHGNSNEISGRKVVNKRRGGDSNHTS